MIPQFFGRLRDGHYHRLSTPLAIFLISRSLIWVIGFVARVAFSSRLGDGPWHTHPGQIYLDIWDRWDSAFYRGIARQGYVYLSPDEPGNVVFFPLYPLLTRLAHLLAAKRFDRSMERLRRWIQLRQNEISAVALIVIGLVLMASGFGGR